jgi:hypothetical protein
MDPLWIAYFVCKTLVGLYFLLFWYILRIKPKNRPGSRKLQTKDVLTHLYRRVNMKSLNMLLKCVLHDCSMHCGTTTTRDYKTITGRVRHEGLSFLTITLSDFASDFESCLERGHIEPTDFLAFKKNGAIPRLFSGMLAQVFDKSGVLIDEPSIHAIRCIRQVCRMWKKILLPCKEERNLAAIEKYIDVERELSMMRFSVTESELHSKFAQVSRLIWNPMFGTLTEKLVSRTLVPNHGTGAVATKVLPNQKYHWKQWHQRLEEFFPSSAFCYNNYSNFLERSSEIAYADPDTEQPVRVVFVPKTLKTPRVIAVEPACMQYAQQALMAELVDEIESAPLTRGHINFADQTINRELALLSSKHRLYSTLDLSDASDRVHSALVDLMIGNRGPLRTAIFDCRSLRAKLPTGKVLPLQKFASMGSALCFPIESMVFFTILVLSELERQGLRLSARNVKIVSRNLYVYGDDLIIPTDGVSSAVMHLEAFGLKVNTRKSFSKGNFRESCGMDAYDGVDITPVYLRRKLPTSRHDVSDIVSAVSLSNQLHERGFLYAAKCIEEHLTRLKLDIPYVTETSSCVGYIRFDKSPTVHRRNEKLQRPEVRGYVVVPRKQNDIIDGHPALMKWFLKGLNPEKKHYEQSVSRGRLAIKVRWCSVY